MDVVNIDIAKVPDLKCVLKPEVLVPIIFVHEELTKGWFSVVLTTNTYNSTVRTITHYFQHVLRETYSLWTVKKSVNSGKLLVKSVYYGP